jgi:hypothetical protein
MRKRPSDQSAELHSDAWDRFERAIDVVAKSPPQHRIKSKKKAKRGASSSPSSTKQKSSSQGT